MIIFIDSRGATISIPERQARKRWLWIGEIKIGYTFKLQFGMSELKDVPDQKRNRPIIPIFTVPQPLLPSNHHSMNLEPLTELEMYKREYSRLLRDNQRLISELNRVVTEKDELEHKYNNLQTDRPSNEQRKKRHRRSANQIIRQFECIAQKCGKSYGTEASLIQHAKLKHRELYESPAFEEHLAALRKKQGSQPDSSILSNGEKS